MGRDERRIVIAMDGSKHSEQTFQWYLDNMRHEEDIVYMAWNVDPHPATFGTVNLMTGDPDLISKIMSEHTVHVTYTVKAMQQKLTDAQVTGQVLQLHGQKAGESIIKCAGEQKADMIICGSRGLSTLRRTLIGSVSDYILHHAHIPVVICRFDKLTAGVNKMAIE